MSFTYVPDTKVPGVYFELGPGQGTTEEVGPVLIIGPHTSSSTLADNTPALFLGTSWEDCEAFAGAKSILAHMLWRYRQTDPTGAVYAIGLPDNAAGVAATGTLAFSGTATAGGTVSLRINGRAIRAGVSKGATAADVVDALVPLINADGRTAVSAADDGDDVDLTAANDGELGNLVVIESNPFPGDATPAGLSLTVTAMASGLRDADITTALGNLDDDRYSTIVHPFIDAPSLTAVENELNEDSTGRWHPTRQLWGYAIVGSRDSAVDNITLSAGRNCRYSVIVDVPETTPEPPWGVAAAVAGRVRVSALAGDNSPARQFTGLTVPGYPSPRGSRRTYTDKSALIDGGLGTLSESDTGIEILRLTTTSENANYLFLNDVLVSMRVFIRLIAAIRATYPRHLLVDDASKLRAGVDAVDPAGFKAFLVGEMRKLERIGWVQNVDDFADSLVVAINSSNSNRIDTNMTPEYVRQFVISANRVDPAA